MTSPPSPPTCYRHPGRPTHVRCIRCDRYICPDCMRAAAVGHQCVACAEAGVKSVRQPELQFGGRPGAETPAITYTLIGLNAVMFVAASAVRGLTGELSLWPLGVDDGQLYRLATSAFLHHGLMHLMFNMWALYVVGPPLEAWLGRLRFGALYALSALGGSVGIYLFAPENSVTVGASGAVFGLFGAVLVVARRLKLDVRWVVALIVINLVITFTVPNISWQGHLGGLATGLLVAAIFVYAPRQQRNLVQAAASLAVLALFAALIAGRAGVLPGLS